MEAEGGGKEKGKIIIISLHRKAMCLRLHIKWIIRGILFQLQSTTSPRGSMLYHLLRWQGWFFYFFFFLFGGGGGVFVCSFFFLGFLLSS